MEFFLPELGGDANYSAAVKRPVSSQDVKSTIISKAKLFLEHGVLDDFSVARFLQSTASNILHHIEERQQDTAPSLCNAHLLPFHINYTGPAKVHSFFNPSKKGFQSEASHTQLSALPNLSDVQANGNECTTTVSEINFSSKDTALRQRYIAVSEDRQEGVWYANFRGRALLGLPVQLPCNTQTRMDVFVGILSGGLDEREMEELKCTEGNAKERSKLVPITSCPDITLWKHDELPTSSDKFVQWMDYMDVFTMMNNYGDFDYF